MDHDHRITHRITHRRRRQRDHRRPVAALGALLLGVAVAGCGETAGDESGDAATEAACGPLDETAEVTVSASSANMAFAGVQLTDALGGFEDMGVDVSFEALSAADALAPLGQGRIDVTISTLNAGVLNAIDSGVDIRWAAPLYKAHPDAGEGLWMQPDLVPEGEEFDVSMLEGKTVATPAGLGGTSTYILAEQMQEAGLTFDDLNYRQMGTADILAGLEQGSLDMGWLSDPFWQEAESGDLEHYRGFGDQNGTAILTGPGFNDRPDVAVAFFQAIHNTIAERLGDGYLDDPEVREALSSTLGVPAEQLDNPTPHVFDPQLELPGGDEFVEGMQETFIEMGGLLEYDEPLPGDEVIDRSFAERAISCAEE